MNVKKFLLASVVYFLIATLFHTVGAMLTMDYYMDPAYLSIWSTVMMPGGGQPGMAFFLASAGISLLSAFIVVYIFDLVRRSVPGKDRLTKGLSYGMILFLLGTAPGVLMTILMVNIPWGLAAEWAIEGLAVNLVGAIAVAKIIR